jgi:hypothetical protein
VFAQRSTRACAIFFFSHLRVASRTWRAFVTLVTRKFSYLIYYTVDAAAEETVVLNVKHPAQERDQSDA